MCRRGLAIGVALVAILPATTPAATAAPVLAAQSTGQTAFIEALAAIPAAVEALAAAREGLRTSQVRHAMARAVADEIRTDFSLATDTLHEQTLVRTRAELAAVRAQATVDDAARQLYSSGGSVPTLVDVMLTAESQDGLMRSLVTRQYLSAAASDQVLTGSWAQAEAVRAEQARVQAEARWSAAANHWNTAAAELASAAGDRTAAQVELDAARKKHKKLMKITKVDRSSEYGRIKQCGDWLTKLLSKTGFTGENLREAWAIVMRESGGREDAVSVSNDLGLFQINTATWQGQPWFDRAELLKRKFNAKVGYLLSDGGKSWYSWGLDGHGRPDAGAYINAGWSKERIVSKIVEPYVLWYARYPCRPSYEKNTWLGLPIDLVEASKPRSEDQLPAPLLTGGGQLPSGAASDQSPPMIPGQPSPIASPTPSIAVDPTTTTEPSSPPQETAAPSTAEPGPASPSP